MREALYFLAALVALALIVIAIIRNRDRAARVRRAPARSRGPRSPEGLEPGFFNIGRRFERFDVMMDYEDANGNITRRRVTLTQVVADHSGYIHLLGYCHLRQAPREFRADRVIALADTDGVVIDLRVVLAQKLGISLWARAIRAKMSVRQP